MIPIDSMKPVQSHYSQDSDDSQDSGCYSVSTDGETKLQVQSVDIISSVCGQVVNNTVKLVYINSGVKHGSITTPNSSKDFKLKFIYPNNNSKSAVYHLSIELPQRNIKVTGFCKEKNKAEQEFKKAVKSGNAAVVAKNSVSCENLVLEAEA